MQFDSLGVQLLHVEEYLRLRGGPMRGAIPREPGLYVWTLDLRYLAAQPSHAGDRRRDLRARLDKRLSRVGRTSHDREAGQAGLHRKVIVRDMPKRLRERTGRDLDALAGIDSRFEWALMCGTALARPLYLGKAMNLRQRITSHLGPQGDARMLLQGIGLTPSDCSVLLLTLPPPPSAAPAPAVPGGTLFGPDPDETDDDGDGDAEEDDAGDGGGPPGLSGPPGAPGAPGAPAQAGGRVQDPRADQLITLAESLAIRSAQPLLNREAT